MLCTTQEIYDVEMTSLSIPKKFRGACFILNDSDATTHYFDHQKDCYHIAVVCIDASKMTEPIHTASLLVHEAVHVWQRIRDLMGEDSPSSEFEAYAIQHISSELMVEYARQMSIAATVG